MRSDLGGQLIDLSDEFIVELDVHSHVQNLAHNTLRAFGEKLGSDLQVLPHERRTRPRFMGEIRTEADHLGVVLVDVEAHHVALIRKGGGSAAVKNSMVRGWITSDANLASSARTVKRLLNSSLSKRTFLPPQLPPTESMGSVNGIRTAVTISEWFSVTVRVWLGHEWYLLGGMPEARPGQVVRRDQGVVTADQLPIGVTVEAKS